jgi:hypothetical protein
MGWSISDTTRIAFIDAIPTRRRYGNTRIIFFACRLLKLQQIGQDGEGFPLVCGIAGG